MITQAAALGLVALLLLLLLSLALGAMAWARQVRQLRKARAESEARLHGIFETAVDAILIVNEQQLIVQANAAAAAMFRCLQDQLVGTPLERLIPPRQREQHRLHVQAFDQAPQPARHMGRTREVMALRPDGQEFPIEVSISNMSIDGERLYVVIHRDITERTQAQQALLAGKSKLEAALASMTDAVLITDGEARVQEVNAAYSRFHRCEDGAARTWTLAEYQALIEVRGPDGELAPQEQWPVGRALRGESASSVEYQLRRRDTDESWIGSFSFAPVRSGEGAIVGSVIVARDVTAIKLAQADLGASHAALQRFIANQDRVQDDERSRIARELHDDLQQTLAAIRLRLAAMGQRQTIAAAEMAAPLAELDKLAAQAIASTRRIVKDLRPQLLDELGLVPALQVLADQFALRAGLAATLQADDAVEAAVAGAPALCNCLFRVTQEALNNAARHARASRVQVRLALVSPGQISLSVVDNGCGITPGDRRRRDAFGILGMQERVRAQGGTLRIENPAAGGTLLEVLAPLDAQPAAAPLIGPLQAQWPRLLNRAATQALQITIDAMAGVVAVLDGEGVVRLVNRKWVETAESHGHPAARGMGAGVNYLEVCRHGADLDASVRPVFQGLSEVLEVRSQLFEFEYPCHTPAGERWFRMSATPMSNGDVLVTHFLLR